MAAAPSLFCMALSIAEVRRLPHWCYDRNSLSPGGFLIIENRKNRDQRPYDFTAKKSTIPLDHAVLCLDCNCVSDANRECPACSSRALMNLSVVLNRPVEVARYQKLSVAA